MNGSLVKMSKPTKTFERYEVVKVPFPFTDIKAVKVRPALILSTARHFNAQVGMSVMAMITSVKQMQNPWPTDVVIEDLNATGLPAPSMIRFKLFTLDHRLIVGRLGELSRKDHVHVQKHLKEILGLIA